MRDRSLLEDPQNHPVEIAEVLVPPLRWAPPGTLGEIQPFHYVGKRRWQAARPRAPGLQRLGDNLKALCRLIDAPEGPGGPRDFSVKEPTRIGLQLATLGELRHYSHG